MHQIRIGGEAFEYLALTIHGACLPDDCRRIHGWAANRYTERAYPITPPAPRCLRVPEAQRCP